MRQEVQRKIQNILRTFRSVADKIKTNDSVLMAP